MRRELTLIRHLWGVAEPLGALGRFAGLGFAGIETSIASLPPDGRDRLLAGCAEHGLGLVAMAYTRAGEARLGSVDDHLASLRAQIGASLPGRPWLMNVHSGCDAWTMPEMIRYFREAVRIAADAPFPIVHETHRGRCLYSPWIAREILDAVPDLRLCADFSHWVCVAERLLDDQADLLRRVAGHVDHIHARVGHSQGPQVGDPRAPEHAEALAAHERWWDMVWSSQRQRRLARHTLTPEFGPPPYQPTLPWTRAPVADVDAICTWQAHRQRDRFAAGAGA